MGSFHAGAARHYRTVGIESRVADSDPHTLILMLFDGALERIAQARAAIDGRDRASKHAALAAAADIVNGLRGALDHESGGQLSQRLDALYDYVGRRLLHANVHNDAAALDEASGLLAQVRSAWAALPANG